MAKSVDDGNGNDDNDSLSMLFKAKMTQDSSFQLKAKVSSHDRTIPAKQFQVSYKTYASGLDLTVL